MGLNFQAVLGGISEQIAENIEEDSKRVKLILDKAWDRHTQRFIAKRDKEENKAELVEQVLKKIGSYTNNNADIAASIFNKLGGDVDLANDWLKGASQVTSVSGQSLQDLGYIDSLPDDFKSSGISMSEYAKSFGKGVTFDKETPELAGMITRPDALGGLGEKRVTSDFARRTKRLEKAGLMPEGFVATKVNYADINVDLSLKNIVQSSKDTKNILANLISRAPDGPKKKLLQSRYDELADIEFEAKGIDQSARDAMNTKFNDFLKREAAQDNPEITGVNITIKMGSDGKTVEAYEVNDVEKYKTWKKQNIEKLGNQYSDGFKGQELKTFNNVYKLNTANLLAVDEATKTNQVQDIVKKPSDLIKEYNEGKTIIITQELLDASPTSPKLKGKQVGQTLTMPKAPKVEVNETKLPKNVATGG